MFRPFTIFLGCWALALLAGCGPPAPPASPADNQADNQAAAHDEEHSADHAHEHPTQGPHGGDLIELGHEEYQAELVHDEQSGSVTIHLLDAATQQPVAIAQSEITLQLFHDGQFVSYALEAVAGSGAAAGAASEFNIADADLCEDLCHEEETRGRLQVTIAGKQYTGTIEHADHDDADHGHEGHDHDDDHKDH